MFLLLYLLLLLKSSSSISEPQDGSLGFWDIFMLHLPDLRTVEVKELNNVLQPPPPPGVNQLNKERIVRKAIKPPSTGLKSGNSEASNRATDRYIIRLLQNLHSKVSQLAEQKKRSTLENVQDQLVEQYQPSSSLAHQPFTRNIQDASVYTTNITTGFQAPLYTTERITGSGRVIFPDEFDKLEQLKYKKQPLESNFYQDKNKEKFNDQNSAPGMNLKEKDLSVEDRKLKIFQLIQEQRDLLLKAIDEDEKDEFNKILNYQKRENIYDFLQESYLKKLQKKSFIGPLLQQETNETSVTVREAEFNNNHELQSNSTDFIGPLLQNKNIHAYFLTGDIEPAPDQTRVSVSLENNQISLSLDNSDPTVLSEDSAIKSETTAEKDQEEILGLEEVYLGDVKSNLKIKKRGKNEKEDNSDQKYENVMNETPKESDVTDAYDHTDSGSIESMDKFRELLKTLIIPSTEYEATTPSFPINEKIKTNSYQYSHFVVDQSY